MYSSQLGGSEMNEIASRIFWKEKSRSLSRAANARSAYFSVQPHHHHHHHHHGSKNCGRVYAHDREAGPRRRLSLSDRGQKTVRGKWQVGRDGRMVMQYEALFE